MAQRWAGDRGDVIISGLMRTTVALLVLAAVLYEVGAVAVNAVQLSEMADDAARRGAREAADGASTSEVELAVLDALANETGVVVEAVSTTSHTATVTLRRAPLFLFAHRVPALREHFSGRVSHTARAPSV